uniref:Mitochondria-eating protein C-terminal domain-containing protein n=1 Tax=Magallana gigas TaxID=29159 RepID=K1PU25_MAGGI
MSCASKRSMPRDETEDLAILRLTIKRLQSLENERSGHGKAGRKLDISQLENQILANIKTVEKHFKHYLETNGYNEAIYRPPSISQSVTSLNEEQTINASLFEVIKKFEFDNKRLEDDCQDYRLRIKSLQESDERNEKTIERLRKEQQTSETCQYRLHGEIDSLKQKIDYLENAQVLKTEEILRLTEENRIREERLNKRILELEREVHIHKLALINSNTKHNLTEADRLRLKALEHKWNKMTNICPEENKYAEIMWCMSKLFIHQWEEARNTLRLSGSDDGQIVHVLGRILKCSGPSRLVELTFGVIEEHSAQVLSSLYEVVDKSLSTELNEVTDSTALNKFKERSVLAFWRLLVKYRDFRLDWNHPGPENKLDVGVVSCDTVTLSDRHRCLKDLEAGFRKLKQREKKNKYSADDDDCREAAKKLITDLRELTDSGSDEVLPFGITERGIVNRLEKELRSSDQAYQKKVTELDTEKANHNKSKDRLEKEIQQREDEIKLIKSELEENENAKRILEKDNKSLIIETERINTELGKSENERRNLEAEIKSLKSELQDVKDAKDELENKNKRFKTESEQLRTKLEDAEQNQGLSAAAAHRLRDQNPGITDLSDPNRPLKLAEKVSELYDNEWTNAMENLENLDIQEDKGIKILLKIIKNVFDTCVDFGDTHLESFPDLLALPPVIYQLQKKRVYFEAHRKTKLKIKQKVYDSCKEYIEKCVELCWMMRIQDPPIYMEADYQTNSAFDSNKMRSYTKAGKFVHFVVWPTFFLHKDGPLLAKGVVQGSKSEVAEEESSSSSADDTDDDKYKIAPTVSSDDIKNRTNDVSDVKQSDSGNGRLPNDKNITTTDTESPEKDKEKDDKSPAGNQADQGNGDQTTDKSNTTIETNSSETDNNEEDVSQITESDPEKKNLPNDNSNTSYGSNSEENGDN